MAKSMRIVGGKWRSRRLVYPNARTTKPVPDRLKEALFSMLGSYYDLPGELPPLSVADVFAGSGSMGLEALSRGAASCCFYEREVETLRVLRRNLEDVQVGTEARVISRDAWMAAVSDPDGHPFELVLLDPPFADSNDVSDGGAVRRYLARLNETVTAISSKPARATEFPKVPEPPKMPEPPKTPESPKTPGFSAEAELSTAPESSTVPDPSTAPEPPTVSESSTVPESTAPPVVARPLVVLHHAAAVHFDLPAEDDWRILKVRKFGSNAVTFFKHD